MGLTKIAAVVGPTASGKTALAVEIAKKYGGEVVSADSMQIYKNMNIGTAKPTPEETKGIPHHMIDIIDPKEDYSVAQYVADARKVIDEIKSRNRLPVLCGGTGLYVNSLIDNIEFSKTERDGKLRAELRALAEKEGGEALLKILREFDTESADKLHPNNLGRIIRAIEVYKTTGITMTEQNRRSKQHEPRYNAVMLGLYFENRETLYKRIEKRVDLMFQQGLYDEVKALYSKGIDRNTTAMQAIGYKEFAEVFDGKLSLEEASEKIKIGTRHYAKRQLTWFRRDSRINWIAADDGFEKVCQKAFDIIDNWTSI